MGGHHNYLRHFIDMADGYDAYMSHFSAKTRSTLRRKQRKLSQEAALEDSGAAEIHEYRSPAEIAEFMDLVVPLSRRTYQARTLDAGLPEDDASRADMMALAAQDNLRCFLLYFRGVPISYLCLPIEGNTVVYAFLGYDEDYRRLSPGTVLQMYALERLFAENRYRYFDFTEGDGPHKAMFGNRSIEACSFFLMKSTPGNRVLLGALDMFDAGVAQVKALLAKTGAQSKVRQTIRGA
jgi:CelD/BcsL family acetyltransferase involved in cellulose biosynthesis